MDIQYESYIGQKKSIISCDLKLYKWGGILKNQVI